MIHVDADRAGRSILTIWNGIVQFENFGPGACTVLAWATLSASVLDEDSIPFTPPSFLSDEIRARVL